MSFTAFVRLTIKITELVVKAIAAVFRATWRVLTAAARGVVRLVNWGAQRIGERRTTREALEEMEANAMENN